MHACTDGQTALTSDQPVLGGVCGQLLDPSIQVTRNIGERVRGLVESNLQERAAPGELVRGEEGARPPAAAGGDAYAATAASAGIAA